MWRWPAPVRMLASAAVGGGLIDASSIVNIGVTHSYRRTDLDAHAQDAHDAMGIERVGPTLFTAADVTLGVVAIDEAVRCDATVGITRPTWAADVDDAVGAWAPGTVNVVVQLPVCLTDAAMVNAVITATEAKAQAFGDAAIPGTGTASDAVVIVVDPTGPSEPFGGPRATWGARIARAVHEAVVEGIRRHP